VRSRPARWVLYSAIAVLYVLHNDIWLWHDGRIVLGLPASLLYQVVYCGVVAVIVALVVRFAWPYPDDAERGSRP